MKAGHAHRNQRSSAPTSHSLSQTNNNFLQYSGTSRSLATQQLYQFSSFLPISSLSPSIISTRHPRPIIMRSTLSAVVALAAIAGAQSTTSIDIAAISVPAPTEVFVLPVVYVTEAGAPVLTATTLAATATPSSDAGATNVFDSPLDVSAAISSASEIAMATSTPLSRVKRDACVQQPLGISYNSVPDTAAAFAADTYYGLKAVAAGAPTGYVQTMSNLTASNSADKYMGFTLLQSYDVVSCVNQCNAISGCNSVNIYFERDPTINPDSSACSQNPPSTINIKVSFPILI